MPESIETYIVDSFTNQPFKGNPAGVCLLTHHLSDEKMQLIAMELGLSETAFVTQLKEKNSYSIRFFSPKMEIPLCGHATLASSKVVFEACPAIDKINFITVQNLLLTTTKHDNIIAMEFPVYDTIPQNTPKALLNALELQEITNSVYNKETNILLLEIESSEVLRQINPDFEMLKRSHNAINGVLVTSLSKSKDYDFESRYFWPWSGTNEDPVTGGTHTFLAKYWSLRLNKKKMNSYQCSKRSGFMEVELVSNDKLIIRSEAQIVFKGELQN